MTNVLLLASHQIAEYDDVRMFHDAGFGIFAPGGYENPNTPGEGLRPALPDVPYHEDLAAACRRKREAHAEDDARVAIDWAKYDLADEVVDWADVVIVHHFPELWIRSNWEKIRTKRVIWRTCGQSNPRLERFMEFFRQGGLQIVRYSPAERRFFERIGAFAGQDAIIRFGKYPADYPQWEGVTFHPPAVGNVTQHMVERGDAVGYGFWRAATAGLPVKPAGPGSEAIGGVGKLSYGEMAQYLRTLRVYLYTGTQPASYTLGLIEAMMVGVPVVSIGPRAWHPDAPDLFEGFALAEGLTEWSGLGTAGVMEDDPGYVNKRLRVLLSDDREALARSRAQRVRAHALFGIEAVAAQWREFLA